MLFPCVDCFTDLIFSQQEASLDQFLSELGYPWKEKTEDPTYKMFLRQ